MANSTTGKSQNKQARQAALSTILLLLLLLLILLLIAAATERTDILKFASLLWIPGSLQLSTKYLLLDPIDQHDRD